MYHFTLKELDEIEEEFSRQVAGEQTSVAVWPYLGVPIFPATSVEVPVTGSKSSAVSKTVIVPSAQDGLQDWLQPPAINTLPFGSLVAVCCTRGTVRLDWPDGVPMRAKLLAPGR